MALPAPRPRARPAQAWAGLERWQRMLAAITVAGFATRLAWVLFAARSPLAGHDPYYYLAYAERLADGHGYTTPQGTATGYYPVGYPAALAGALWLVGVLPGNHVLGAALALNLIAGTATIVAVGVLGRRVVGARAGCAAAAIVAFLPNFVFHTAAVLSETTFNLVLAAALLVVCWRPWREPWSARRVAAAGALIGCAVLVRPVALVLAPVVVAGWVIARPDRRQLVGRVAGFVAVVLVIVGPWAVRNRTALGRLALSTNTGDNLCIGNNPDATGGFNLAPYCFAEEPPELFLTGGGWA